MILEFSKPISVNLKEELFGQALQSQEDQEYNKLLRVIEALGWLEEYKELEGELIQWPTVKTESEKLYAE